MKILKLFNNAFNHNPKYDDLRKSLQWERKRISKKDPVKGEERFFHQWIQYIGGRGYNEFLDYTLMAIKIAAMYDVILVDADGEYNEENKNGFDILVEMIEELVRENTGDKHDLYQNIPYDIDNLKNPDKWKIFNDILIDSMNFKGTSDVAFKTINPQ